MSSIELRGAHTSTYKNSVINKIVQWARDNPTSAKVVIVSLIVFGALMLSASIACPPLLSFSFIALGGLFIAGIPIGGIILAIGVVLHKLCPWFVPKKPNMCDHIFAQLEGKSYSIPGCYATLTYQNDLPIFRVKADSFKKAGFAHGYLLANYIEKLLEKWDVLLKFHPAFPSPHKMPRLMEKFRAQIPEEQLEEMQGLVDGYNAKMGKKLLSLEKCLLLHLIPEHHHFNPKAVEKLLEAGGRSEPTNILAPLSSTMAVGCTVVVARDDKSKDLLFSRNMDWPSLGVAGTHSLVISRDIAIAGGKKRFRTVDVTVPGLIGIGTGINEHGLTMAVNICEGRTDEVRGMPIVLLIRHLLENASCIEEVEGLLTKYNALGPMHITVADRKNNAASFHFYQGEQDKLVVRRLSNKIEYLHTSNCRYRANGTPYAHHFNSNERESNISAFFDSVERAVNERTLTDVLKLPLVNNNITTHSVFIKPNTGIMRVGLANGYSADQDLREINTHDIIQQTSSINT